MVKEVLSEHDSLLREWNDIRERLTRAGEKRPKSKEELHEAFGVLSDVYSKAYLFMSKFAVHELKEEYWIYPDMNERGRLEVTLRLIDDHRRLNLMLDEIRKALDEYRFMKIEEWELKDKIEATNNKMNSLLMEHMKIEHEEFSKLL
ncbi:MAG: hemerythrin domain-containing protein [Aigarchaeota archaeon]|nr:hemerythrin domain-containing protein [Aigarchaeota archaeon]